jgi:hypothetical protein
MIFSFFYLFILSSEMRNILRNTISISLIGPDFVSMCARSLASERPQEEK